jgi:5-formyltetrahydrofolate cyclo-ligase
MEMVAGAFKVAIPAFIEWMVPEIILVPLVAWDKEGGRLGYGGGFYDRTIEGLRARGPILAIGFAFNAQEDLNLPLEPTDQNLDMVITEDRILKFND